MKLAALLLFSIVGAQAPADSEARAADTAVAAPDSAAAPVEAAPDSMEAAPDSEMEDTLTAPGGDTAAADTGAPAKPLAVFFLGIESRVDNRIHRRLEERVFELLASKTSYLLRGPADFSPVSAKTGIRHRSLTLNEARQFKTLTGDRIFVSGDLRDFRLELKRTLGLLPFGRVRGEIVCHLQVLDPDRNEIRFHGDVRFVGEGDLELVGYGARGGLLPLSAVEERYFVGELLKGEAETLAETVTAACEGLLEKPRPAASTSRRPVKPGTE